MRRLSIVNRSGDIVSCCVERAVRDEHTGTQVIFPSASVTLELPSFRANLVLSSHTTNEKSDYADESKILEPDDFTIRAPLTPMALWKLVQVPESCPWAIYRIKVRTLSNILLRCKLMPVTLLRLRRSTTACSSCRSETPVVS